MTALIVIIMWLRATPFLVAMYVGHHSDLHTTAFVKKHNSSHNSNLCIVYTIARAIYSLFVVSDHLHICVNCTVVNSKRIYPLCGWWPTFQALKYWYVHLPRFFACLFPRTVIWFSGGASRLLLNWCVLSAYQQSSVGSSFFRHFIRRYEQCINFHLYHLLLVVQFLQHNWAGYCVREKFNLHRHDYVRRGVYII